MNILYLTPGIFDKGGISRYNRFQIRAIRDNFGENSVSVLSLMGPDGEGFEENIPITWHGTPTPTMFSRMNFSLQAIRIATFHHPEIILTGHLNFGPLGQLCAFLSRGILAQNIYGREVWSGASKVRERALFGAESVISDCLNTAEYALKQGLCRQLPNVVWDCVDTHSYTPGDPDKNVLKHYGITKQSRFRLMFLGRLHESVRYKGTERILRLTAQLSEDFECVIAGGGDDVVHLKKLAAELGISNRTFFPGRIDEVHMPDVYRSADVFYLLSEVGKGMGEGLPLTPIEAMACGVPVIVGDQDGSREILDNTGGGICISLDQQEDIITYIRKLKNDIDFMNSERLSARMRVENAFSYEKFSEKTAAILNKLFA